MRSPPDRELARRIAVPPIVTSGATINAQVWARDPAHQDGFLLSNGIEVTVCPEWCPSTPLLSWLDGT